MVKKSDLPNKMIPFNSNKKNYHQKKDMKDIANFPSPVISILMGNVNTGKTRTLKNILVHKTLHTNALCYILHLKHAQSMMILNLYKLLMKYLT